MALNKSSIIKMAENSNPKRKSVKRKRKAGGRVRNLGELFKKGSGTFNEIGAEAQPQDILAYTSTLAQTTTQQVYKAVLATIASTLRTRLSTKDVTVVSEAIPPPAPPPRSISGSRAELNLAPTLSLCSACGSTLDKTSDNKSNKINEKSPSVSVFQSYSKISLIVFKALQELGVPVTATEIIDYVATVALVDPQVIFQIVYSTLDWAEIAGFIHRIGNQFCISYRDIFDKNPQLFYELTEKNNVVKLCSSNLSFGLGVDSSENKQKIGRSSKKRLKKPRSWKKLTPQKSLISQMPSQRFRLY